jgi:Holliday junction DNA helicase RuvA
MISFLQGILASRQADRVEVDVNGVGYEAFVSQRTLQALPPLGQAVTLKTYLHVREDLQQLFGFINEGEKQAFLLALSVSGIGPKASLNLLSALSPEAFYDAILHNDLGVLKSVPGIGSKTAQHLVLELKDKVAKLAGGSPFTPEAPLGPEAKNLSDAVLALVSLGYTPAQSRRVVLDAAQALGPKSTVEDLLRAGLKSIAST